ncbi:hypothetical protein [Erwinia phage vB_Ea277G]|jgi:hypothetical protein|nr:hypothetical protein [Erwinia phage vB_Ea277G]
MEKKDKGVSLNIGSLNVPNRNGVSYSPDAIEAALERALDGSKVSANAALFPNGQIPNFAQFLKMIAPHLSEEKIRMMAEMAERMPDYPDIAAKHHHGQELFDRIKARMANEPAGFKVLTMRAPTPTDWNKEFDELGLGRKEADVEISISPRMIDGQVVSYGVVKSRQGHPDALNVEIDSLPNWLRDVDLPLDPIDRDVQCQYLNEIRPNEPSARLKRSLDKLDGGVKAVTLDIPDPFGSSPGCRSLLNTFGSARQRVNGDITVNGKQRKELVTNAKGTMVFPRAKQKFGRR